VIGQPALTSTHHSNSFSPRPLAYATARWNRFVAAVAPEGPATYLAALVFGLRVVSAGMAYLIQIFLARSMGAFDYGIYIYAWTWVVMIGSLADFGFLTTAQRFIPEYVVRKQLSLLRGFLCAAQWVPAIGGGGVCVFGLALVFAFRNSLAPHNVVPLYLACLCLPFYVLGSVQDGIARAYDWMVLGLAPDYLLRPAALFFLVAAVAVAGVMPDARIVMALVVAATAGAALVQLTVLNRRLRKVAAGAMHFDMRLWSRVSFPIFLFSAFYLLLTNVDVVILEYFRTPQELAVYYAASKTLALVAFVSFSICTVSARRFSAYWTAGDRDQLERYFAQAIRWTFWSSLGGAVFILIAAKPLLALFGPIYVSGYELMFIMALGLILQASTGPAEAILNMLHQEATCAGVYAVSFVFNLVSCVLLVPQYGAFGAAIAVTAALTLKSLLLFIFIKRRLSLHAFIWRLPLGRLVRSAP
jgi:O-antigen/teichoic acid export membrane protein